MNDVSPATNGQMATTDPSAFEALISTGIIGLDEVRSMPLGTRVMLHDGLREFFWTRAEKMSRSASCPAHLKDDPETAFAVVRMALNWNMDYFSVAQSTYSPGGGKIGIEGKLAVGAMIGSRKVKSIRYEHGGDWDKVAGKFEMKTSAKGRPYMAAKYTQQDEIGLYVIATATMHDDTEVSTPKVFLNACHPRNSTLWAANPRRQIMYVADRMLFQIACADILMGVHFDVGLDEVPAEPIDITPPKSVNLEEEGVKGAGETAPMTEAGVVEDTPKDSGSEPVRQKAKSAEMPETTARRPRIKLQFGGKEVYQTGFFADVKQLLDAVETPEAFSQLKVAIFGAINTAEPASGQAKLKEHVTPMIEAVEAEFAEAEEPEQSEHDQETGEIRDPNPEQTVAQAEELDLA